ncbi:MAG: hypothetical protein HKN24_09665 [Acidimicrobiales bacterium]|nr:hypothetical protein [Acidimicrobiales bacterium]
MIAQRSAVTKGKKMHSPVDPTRLLGRNSQVHTGEGVITGTILAAGPRGVSVQCSDGVIEVASADLRSIRTL